MTSAPIYLDNNATTSMDPLVAQRMLELHLEGIANPASQHRPGRRALHLLEEAKNELLELLGANNSGMDAANVVLTSGGTEANNLVLRGFDNREAGDIIVGATEHPSVMDAAQLGGSDRCRILPVDASGACDLDRLREWLRKDAARIRLVSVMYGNNETGVIQELREICAICRLFDVPVHSDAVQAVGKIDVNMTDLGLTGLSLTAHKLHGPVGIGALILSGNCKLNPLLVGGGQQLGLRPGTEPVIPAVALTMAVRLSCQAVAAGAYEAVASLRDRFESSLAALDPIEFIAADAQRLPHVSNVAFRGVDRQALYMALDLAGIACSTGSACSSGSSRPSPILTAMGLDQETISSSLRFSWSRFSTSDEVDRAIRIIFEVVNNLRSRSSSPQSTSPRAAKSVSGAID